jgi:hypothetical protein
MNRLFPLSTLALLLAVALAPAAAASESASVSDVKLYCRVGERECAGYLVCVYETKVSERICVVDPCDDTQCLASASAGPRCVVIVPEGGDMGEKVCVDPRAECKVWYERTTFIGTWTICLVPPGSTGGPETSAQPMCMDRYWEVDLGAVRVVSPDSCTYHVYVLGQRVGLE